MYGMNPYNAETDYDLAVAWEEGFLAATEAVLSAAKAKGAGTSWLAAVEDAVHRATRENDRTKT